ncbi:hypothetical protein Z969_02765, partial [Clostridium novyi A str. 4570]
IYLSFLNKRIILDINLGTLIAIIFIITSLSIYKHINFEYVIPCLLYVYSWILLQKYKYKRHAMHAF